MRITNNQPVIPSTCQFCHAPILITDRDEALADSSGAIGSYLVWIDPVALNPSEQAAAVILDRALYLLAATPGGPIRCTYHHGSKYPPVLGGLTELGRAPHHHCHSPLGTTPLPDPPSLRANGERCPCLQLDGAFQCSPPF